MLLACRGEKDLKEKNDGSYRERSKELNRWRGKLEEIGDSKMVVAFSAAPAINASQSKPKEASNREHNTVDQGQDGSPKEN